jgi:hypothetical protein
MEALTEEKKFLETRIAVIKIRIKWQKTGEILKSN